MKRRRSTQGFTLVEVLVALTLMAAMAVMAWRGIDAMLRSREISQASLLRSERLHTVLAQWEQDLRSLQDSSTLNPLSFDGISLLLTRRQREGMQVVSWNLRDGRLYRWESPVVTTQSALIEAYARSQQALLQDSQQQVVMEGVASWQMFFYRGNAWSNAQSSDDIGSEEKPTGAPPSAASGASSQGGTPPPSPRRLLPSGVRMQLDFAAGSGLDGRLVRQLALEPQS